MVVCSLSCDQINGIMGIPENRGFGGSRLGPPTRNVWRDFHSFAFRPFWHRPLKIHSRILPEFHLQTICGIILRHFQSWIYDWFHAKLQRCISPSVATKYICNLVIQYNYPKDCGTQASSEAKTPQIDLKTDLGNRPKTLWFENHLRTKPDNRLEPKVVLEVSEDIA